MTLRETFLEAAGMAMDCHARSMAEATRSNKPERIAYWLNEARDDESRARFYLGRAELYELETA